MAKIIKKFFRSLIITVTVLITCAALFFITARTPRFQSYLTKRVTEYISKKINANISIGKVSYSYFNKLVLYDLLIADQNKDTLLAAQQIALNIKEFNPVGQRFRFGNTEIYQPDFRIITDTSGMSNLRWYLDLLTGHTGKDTTSNLLVTISDVSIYDGSFQITNKRDTSANKEGLINFSNLRISSITGETEDFTICNDSVSFIARNLTFSESTGFLAHDIGMNVTIKNSDLFFREIKVITGSSIINAHQIALIPIDSVGFSDFINNVKFNIRLDRSMLGTSDISYFTPSFKGMNESFYLSGKFSGTVAELKGRKVELEYASLTRLKCDFDISGLPSIDNTFAFIDVSEFRTNADDIEKFKIEGKKDISLPKVLHDAGRISFGGNFTGFNTDFVAYGTLKTEKGSFSTDISFRPDSSNLFRFKGLLKARDVDMATLTGDKKQPGKMWFHADMDGYSSSFRHFSAKINGAVDSVGFNNYLYRNILLEGRVTEKIWDGEVNINDKNLKMNLLGSFNFTDTLPEFNFTLNLAHADLHNLNLTKKDSIFEASAILTASFKGNNIDNLDGDLRLQTSTLTNSNGSVSINNCLVRSTTEKGVPLLTLLSDFAEIEVRGPHNYASIGAAVKSELAKLFPTKFKTPSKSTDITKNHFTYKAVFKDINKLSEFFGTGLNISDNSFLNGVFHPDSSHITMKFRSDFVRLNGIYLSRLETDAAITDNRMSVLILSDTIKLPDKSKINNVALNLNTNPDTLNLDINWDNKDNGVTKGDIRAIGFITLNSMKRPVLQVNILPTEAYINSVRWNISPSAITVDSAFTHFDNILVSNGNNIFSLDGKISKYQGEKLTFSFDGLNLDYLNKISSRKKNADDESEGMEMVVGGSMKGIIEVSDINQGLRLESDVKIKDFTFNGSPYGMVSVVSEWDSKIKSVIINISNNYEGAKFFDVSGTYKPSNSIMNLTASLFKMPLNVINPIIKSFASDARGLASGKLTLKGKINQPFLTGTVKAEEASLKIDFLKTRYSFNDSIRFTNKGIIFKNIKILDEKKNQGNLNGIIAHTGFKDINLDLKCDIKNFMVLNTTYKDADYFYGTAYATGIVYIKGPTNKLSLNISAKTENNTSFNVPLNSGSTMGEYPYILFVDSETIEKDNIARDNMFVRKEKASGINLNLDLEVTPSATVQLIMDSKAGDIIKGKGSGNLNINMNNKGEVKMAGDYVISEGNYLFTLGNVINKSFTIEEGGTISWNGGLADAILDLKAVYRTKASLSDLYTDEEAFRKRITVECQLNLSGKLFNPMVVLGVEAPDADNETQEYLKMAVDTEEELSKQFVYLLVMNGFYPDPAIYNSASTGSSSQGASALGVNTTEMLSNQFSNWLSQISNDFDIGFNYRPGDGLTTQEVQAAFSTQLLNDRVTFNGNLDVGGKEINANANNVTTDFTLEYKLTDRLRFKAFNRANNEIMIEKPNYTQGFGLLYRHEFNKFKDLFKKKDGSEKKKSTEEKKQ